MLEACSNLSTKPNISLRVSILTITKRQIVYSHHLWNSVVWIACNLQLGILSKNKCREVWEVAPRIQVWIHWYQMKQLLRSRDYCRASSQWKRKNNSIYIYMSYLQLNHIKRVLVNNSISILNLQVVALNRPLKSWANSILSWKNTIKKV